MTYGVFLAGSLVSLLLLLPMDVTVFTICVTLLGITQGCGTAATIKYVPEYYPKDVGVVVGLVGSLAAAGRLRDAPLFAYLKEWTGQPQSMFWVVFGLTVISLIWLHCVVLRIRRQEQQSI